jgi:hypothetical protein
VINEFERVQKEAVVADGSTITEFSCLEGLEKNHGKSQSVKTMPGPRFELSTFRIQVRSATLEPTCSVYLYRDPGSSLISYPKGYSSSTLISAQNCRAIPDGFRLSLSNGSPRSTEIGRLECEVSKVRHN